MGGPVKIEREDMSAQELRQRAGRVNLDSAVGAKQDLSRLLMLKR